MSNIFCTYNLSKLIRRRKRVKYGKLNTLLGFRHLPDSQLWDAIRDSGVRFYVVTDEGYTLWIDNSAILDRVIQERATWPE